MAKQVRTPPLQPLRGINHDQGSSTFSGAVVVGRAAPVKYLRRLSQVLGLGLDEVAELNDTMVLRILCVLLLLTFGATSLALRTGPERSGLSDRQMLLLRRFAPASGP